MAKSTTSAAVSYSVVVNLSTTEMDTIMDGKLGAHPEDKLSRVANGLVRDLAAGGCMLPSEWAGRIEQAIGTTDPASIVEAVEKSVHKSGEATCVQWVVDPTQIAFYKGLADNVPPNGITLEHQLKSLMDHAFSQGWFNSAAPDVFKILLTPEQFRELQQICGKDLPTGLDVIERLQGSGAAWDHDDDLVLGPVGKEK